MRYKHKLDENLLKIPATKAKYAELAGVGTVGSTEDESSPDEPSCEFELGPVNIIEYIFP